MHVKSKVKYSSAPRAAFQRYSRTITVIAALSGSTITSSPPVEAGVLNQLRSSIDSLRNQRQQRYEQARDSRQRASTLKHRGLAVADRLENTQRLLSTANETYENYRRQTKETEARIVKTRHEVQIAEKKYHLHLDRFQRRLASFQRSGRPSYLQVFLGSRTLSDLTRRTYLFNAITKQDAELHRNLEESRLELARKRNMLQSQWQQRNRLVQATYREKERIARAESQHRSVLAEIHSSQTAALAFAAAQDQAAGEMEGMIHDLSARRAQIVAEYQRRAAAERAAREYSARRRRASITRAVYRNSSSRRSNRRRTRSYSEQLRPMPLSELPATQVAFHDEMVPARRGSGGLSEEFESHAAHQHDDDGWCRPVRGRLSSRYGMRRHPVLRRTKLHTGTDLAASKGTPIKAAKSGTVLYSGWKKGYGNTVIIDHGGGVTTLYGHASKTAAQAGQKVKSGDYIGNVGSTGYSTGPHLHFEVRKNGKPVNPAPYLRKSRD